jgi:hypothetical protein
MKFTSNEQILICIIIGIIVIFVLYNQSEGFATNTEAINNLASLYNNGTLTATNISATGTVSTFGSPTGTNPNQWIFHTPADARKSLFIARRKDDNSDWDWGGNITIDSTGGITANGGITATNLTATGNIYGKGIYGNRFTVYPDKPLMEYNGQLSVDNITSNSTIRGNVIEADKIILRNINGVPVTIRSSDNGFGKVTLYYENPATGKGSNAGPFV